MSAAVTPGAHDDIASVNPDVLGGPIHGGAATVAPSDGALAVVSEAMGDPSVEAGASEQTVVVADRADAPVSVIAERFLRAIVAVVPLDLLEEVHLFSPLRQGVTETGIAVVAAREVIAPRDNLAAPAHAGELALDDQPLADAHAHAHAHGAALADAQDDAGVDVHADAGADAHADVAADADAHVRVDADADADASATDVDDDSPYKEQDDLADGPAALQDDPRIETSAAAPRLRHTIYTARYRLVIKGAERGKWEADVVAEAEAPLITVETVVRGVQRRAGEDSAITRFSAAQTAYALRMTPLDSAAPANPR